MKKLPEEFKKGFTIFYVKNIEQLHNICFNTSPTQTDFEHLEKLGVEIEVHEHDSFMENVINHEQISKDNLIEMLK